MAHTQFVRVRVYPQRTLFLPLVGGAGPDGLLDEVFSVCQSQNLFAGANPSPLLLPTDVECIPHSPSDASLIQSLTWAEPPEIRLVRLSAEGRPVIIARGDVRTVEQCGVESCQMLLLQRKTISDAWTGMVQA
jgi:hypothetical protein